MDELCKEDRFLSVEYSGIMLSDELTESVIHADHGNPVMGGVLEAICQTL